MRCLFILTLLVLLSSCSVRLMDKNILQCASETSGLAVSEDTSQLYTIEDSGNGPHIYEISKDGKYLGRWDFMHRSNVDWEAMADDTNNYFIGDIGNNLRNRDTLTIYQKLVASCPFDDMAKTRFICDHPLAPFDFEAMFFSNDSMYLITKNHREKYTYLFRVEVNFELNNITPIDSARIRGQITGADYDAENHLLIMTGYRWYIPFVLIKKDATPSTALCKPLKRKTFWLRPAVQTEAVVIVNPAEIYVSAEGNPLHKPALFTLKLKKSKKTNQTKNILIDALHF